MRVLVAYDDSEGARQALKVAAKIVASSDGELVVCQVVDPRVDAADVVAPSTNAAMLEVRSRVRTAIEAATADLGVAITVLVEELNRGEDTAERLAAVAATERVDLVAVASRRAVGLRGLFGSVSQEVLRLSPCPVVVVRPDHS